MPTITRAWLAFAAIGAGLIHIALVIGSPPAVAVALALLGIAEFGWGVVAFARDRVPLPRVALVVAITPVLAWGAVLGSSVLARDASIAASTPFLPMAIASIFSLVIAATLAVHSRRGAAASGSPRAPGVARYLLSLVIGAFVVAGMTTPALAATAAGATAQPHGEHTGPPAQEVPTQLMLPDHQH